MAGEIIKCEGICLSVIAWSQTSHIVHWLTPNGRVGTVAKGAERPKSAFLGKYDRNYTCEILYYARTKSELHILREVSPIERRDFLREDYRKLVLAEHYRRITGKLAPAGPEAAEWYGVLNAALNALVAADCALIRLQQLLRFEMTILHLSGLFPELAAEGTRWMLRGERSIPISPEIAQCLARPENITDLRLMLDAVRIIGVYYIFHLDCASEPRRAVLRMIS